MHLAEDGLAYGEAFSPEPALPYDAAKVALSSYWLRYGFLASSVASRVSPVLSANPHP
ncbi:hypothetical protein [Arthrobacter sp. 2MCAF14]|uniref:hypothetical protein n=1 Tax=Arthrobacter sp. 2MCAF14 TaxID=3232982 RepID=UPI003F8DB486